jgi:hypothetical protein
LAAFFATFFFATFFLAAFFVAIRFLPCYMTFPDTIPSCFPAFL